MKIIPVTCALIFHQGKVLAAQRSVTMDLMGKWEFPGGKIEEGELPEDCLLREIREELSIEIQIKSALPHSDHLYPSKVIRLIPFVASWVSGDIKLLEHSQISWLGKNELFSLDWAPADIPIVHDLLKKWVKLVRTTES